MAVSACSFCGKSAGEAEQLFENEELTVAICAVCVTTFAQNVVEPESSE